jgi:hypothetical protein
MTSWEADLCTADPLLRSARSSGSATTSDNEGALFDEKLLNAARGIEKEAKKDISVALVNVGANLRFVAMLIFVLVLLTALAHGMFIVLLALKLDGTGDYNYNVVFLPLCAYYGAMFLFGVVGVASLPIFSLKFEEYATSLTNFQLAWILPEIDRRLHAERNRLTREIELLLAKLFPLQDVCRWVNGYLEEKLIGRDTALQHALEKIDHGDAKLTERLEKHKRARQCTCFCM